MKETIFINVSAFDSLTKQEQSFLCSRFSDPLFMRFIEKQEEAARFQLTSLDPDEEEDADKYRQKAREFRAVWRFWSEFKELANEWAARSTIQRS